MDPHSVHVWTGRIPAIHLGVDVVIPFQLMASLPHGGLQVTTKCILEVTGLDTVQTTASVSGT